MDYASVINRIESARDVPGKAESYERFERALTEARLSLPVTGRGVFLVGGTNGKGTVSKTLETLLGGELGGESDAGVGLYTSPHLMDTTERIRSFGSDLTHDEFVRTFTLIEPIVKKHGLSHFEILTLMAAEIFFGGRVRKPVTYAIFEVGVGGRLDPTRAIPHEISVLTRLGLDHLELLGASLELIAREKFAIVEPGSLCVHAPIENSAAREAARAACLGVGARQVEVPSSPFRVEHGDVGAGALSGAGAAAEPVWILETPWGESRLGLRGARACQNTSLAIGALSELGFDIKARLSLLSRVRWPGRMERVTLAGRPVFLSGDHNPQGVASLTEILEHFDYERLQLVVGIGKNKDRDEMLSLYSALPRARVTLTTTTFRAGDFARYGVWRDRVAQAIEEPSAAVRQALADAGPRDLVLVSGSLYLVGDLRRKMSEGFFGAFTAE